MAEEISGLRLENISLQEKVAELETIGQDTQQQLQEVERAKDKAKEEYARYGAEYSLN